MEEILDTNMNTHQPPKGTMRKIAVKYAIWGVLVAIFITTLLPFLLGQMDTDKVYETFENGGNKDISTLIINGLLTLVSWVIYFFLYFFAIKEYRSALGGYITFGKGFKVAFLSVLIKTVLLALWTYIFYTFIHPSFLEASREVTEEVISNAGDVPEFMSKMFNIMQSPIGMVVTVIFTTLSGGALLSLLAAAIGQKNS